MKIYFAPQLLFLFCLLFLSLPTRAEEAAPPSTPHEISNEEAIAKAQSFLRSTNRDKYWRIDEPTIKLRADGEFKDKIWDISFPPIRKGTDKSDIDTNSDPMAKLVTLMPFLMWVLIDTGKMYYNEFRTRGGRIYVIQTPAKIPTE